MKRLTFEGNFCDIAQCREQPCPFCGSEARLFVNGGARVICPKCYASSRILTDEMEYSSNAVEAVIEAWNRRVDNG